MQFERKHLKKKRKQNNLRVCAFTQRSGVAFGNSMG